MFFSWGGHDFQPIKDGVEFTIDGFIHSGKVQVVYDHCEDLFIIRTLNADGTTKDQRSGLYVDQLQEIMDRLVECDNESDYEANVKADPLCSLIMGAKNIILV